jgi:two-component system chemotaxis sensor kinase CheA
MKDKHREFVDEVEELLDEASASLLEIQESLPTPDPDHVNGIFRAMHTIKGMAGLFGFQAISEISHQLENILDLIRLGKAVINLDVTVFLFRYIDLIKIMVSRIGENVEADSASVDPSLREIEEFTASLTSQSIPVAPILFPGKYRHLLKVFSEYEEHRLRTSIREGKSIYLLEATYPLEDFDVLLRELTDKLKLVGEVVSTMPVSDGVDAGYIGFNIIEASESDQSVIEDAAGCKAAVLVNGGANGPDSEGLFEADSSLKAMSSTIRVDISKVDSILDTISDLSLSSQSVSSIWSELVQKYGNIPVSIDLYRVSQGMQRKMSLLQSQVLEIRMIPVRQIFSRIARIVRRQSAEAGRAIRVDFYGESTEIDKYVAEEVVDPLMHIVRNAIDHGIENDDERIEAGKPSQGLLELRAFQRGHSVIISVTDDGRGIDPEKVREIAIERGLVPVSGTLNRREMLDLLFLPGFSTAHEVSETSGRGVGLDVVKERISFLGGTVEVKGEPGTGTSFVLALPITLSMIRVLLVRVEGEIFAVPLSSMSETFVAERDEIQEVDGQLVYNFRDDVLPVFHPGGLLDFDYRELKRYFTVIVGHGDRRMGILFEEFMGQQEIVIKPLGDYFDGIKGYAGASEIGRHKVILVLDTENLISEAFGQRKKVSG